MYRTAFISRRESCGTSDRHTPALLQLCLTSCERVSVEYPRTNSTQVRVQYLHGTHRLHDLADSGDADSACDQCVCDPATHITGDRHRHPWQHTEDAALHEIETQHLAVSYQSLRNLVYTSVRQLNA